jgi:sulfopyruvate decarboxylase TPP-binding subunit
MLLFEPQEAVALLVRLGVTDVVWVPDSTIGLWESALLAQPRLRLIRVCREGEAWPLAAGLYLGGRQPLILMQCTGLFESGDALRNVLFDLQLPLWALVGARNWLVPDSDDSARRYLEALVKAWQIPCVWIEQPTDKPRIESHFRQHQGAGRPALVLLAEGKG